MASCFNLDPDKKVKLVNQKFSIFEVILPVKITSFKICKYNDVTNTIMKYGMNIQFHMAIDND